MTPPSQNRHSLPYEHLNHTELVVLAQQVDAYAHRGISREDLIQVLETGEPLPHNERPLDKHRDAMALFVIDKWARVASFVSCPLRSRNVRSCYGCTDVQVAECSIHNHHQMYPTTEK